MKKKTLLKILITGDAGVGKTTLVHRYIDGEFIDTTSMTVGVEFHAKEIEMEDTTVQLQIWDIGGQKRFRFMIDNYLKGVKGSLILFDTTSMSSFVNVEKWVQLLRKKNKKLPIILIGAKNDLKDYSMVGDYYAELTKKRFKLLNYVKTSSKLNTNVSDAFEILIKHIIDNHLY